MAMQPIPISVVFEKNVCGGESQGEPIQIPSGSEEHNADQNAHSFTVSTSHPTSEENNNVPSAGDPEAANIDPDTAANQHTENPEVEDPMSTVVTYTGLMAAEADSTMNVLANASVSAEATQENLLEIHQTGPLESAGEPNKEQVDHASISGRSQRNNY